MKTKSLLATNPYLKKQTLRDKLLRRVVLTSSAIEGVGKAAAVGLTKGVAAISSTHPGVSGVKQP